MTPRWFPFAWTVLLSASVITTTAAAQSKNPSTKDKPLVVESSTMQPSVALGRPMLTWWDVKLPKANLITGKFVFHLKSDIRAFATVETEELTINGPEQRIRVLLPAIDAFWTLDQILVDIDFHSREFHGQVSQQILRVPFATKKVFVALVGESRTIRDRSPDREAILEHLRFESVVPATTIPGRDDSTSERLKTFFASIDPADFPAEPLAYCGYDVVILLGEEFRNLRRPQLDGLLAWVKAGGSLYIEPKGVLEPFHLEFLRGLCAESADVVLQTDPTGRLPNDTLQKSPRVMPRGLGAVAMRLEDGAPAALDAGRWEQTAIALWKRRQTLVKADDIQYAAMNRTTGQMEMMTVPNPDPWGLNSLTSNPFRMSQVELLDRLIPEGVRMVPTWLLGLILIVFVLVIGPGDYFVLGWLRARNFTWVTYPVMTLAVTALTVALSDAYMNQGESRRSVVLCDVAPSGEVVRTNRFELLFVGKTRQVTTDVQKSFFTTLTIGQSGFGGSTVILANGMVTQQFATPFGGSTWGSGSTGLEVDDSPASLPITPFQGRLPTEFRVTQNLVKWTPQLNRLFAIPGQQVAPDFDWDEKIQPEEIAILPEHRMTGAMIDRVHHAFGPNALVACFTAQGGWACDHSPGWHSLRNGPNGSPIAAPMFPPPRVANVSNDIYWTEPPFFRWLYSASVAPKPGLMGQQSAGIFSLTFQSSPKGGSSCDDLPVLDTSNPNEWLLVVVVPQQDEFVVYRKRMTLASLISEN